MTGEISQSHIKLVSTATAGLPGEHSPYYRRLLSAGYKGYLQGTIGGATLYGLMGAAIGTVGALALLALTGGAVGAAAFAAVPFFAGYGLIKGATTFGSIGSGAAQIAEYAETNERRRALLDRLAETPSREEAIEIQKMLKEESKESAPPPLFHWKTMLMGAALGAAVAAALLFLPALIPAAAVEGVHIGFLAELPHLVPLAGLTIPALGAVFGAAAGSMIGLDRYYVRRWMDGAENVLHDKNEYEEISVARENEIARLDSIAKATSPSNGASSGNGVDANVTNKKPEITLPLPPFSAPSFESSAPKQEDPKPNHSLPLPSTLLKGGSIEHADRIDAALAKAQAI